MTIYNVDPQEYNKKLAQALKELEEFEMPEWAEYIKTGTAKKRPPQETDFWYNRAASILRQIYTKKIIGVNRLKSRYGSKKNRGMKPERFRKSSGKIIRVILQQAEKAGLVEKSNIKKKGRQLTKKGIEFMNKIGEGK